MTSVRRSSRRRIQTDSEAKSSNGDSRSSSVGKKRKGEELLNTEESCTENETKTKTLREMDATTLSADSNSEGSKAKSSAATEPKTKAKKTKSKPKKNKTTPSDSPKSEKTSPEKEKVSPKKKASPKKSTSTKKKPKVEPQRITERDPIERLWPDNDDNENTRSSSYKFRIVSWNVAGIRALLKNHPDALPSLASQCDVLCLQETKLQEMHVTDPKLKIENLLKEEGFESHWSCSTAKKGYSGTAVFIKQRKNPDSSTDGNENGIKKQQATLNSFFTTSEKKKGDAKNTISLDETTNIPIDVKNLIPVNISKAMGKDEHDAEGRIITVDFPLFSITNVYVPNSGQKLERLSYRTDSWDTDLLQYMMEKERERGVPVIWLGDLNVAHTNLDVWNDGAKHLAKQAGTTPEERESFQKQLDITSTSTTLGKKVGAFLDAFRFLHPDAKGHYTYWSQRAGNRIPNKGLRLDYFICSKNLLIPKSEDTQRDMKVVIRDSYMIPDRMGSDHCPIMLEIEIKQ
eukprot:CAMPEP_0184866184 /NCGR_PEP_ID=MMETSP0580-20130426/21231_1 /TAXON_ID=1118495 /ORGANISM="Dactyliosolen fragilissimus" /LENGTH=515 /DNA_ID=CAMNT_0027365715 /DNA_START=395 /DNA_END=1942 /DNA_ORIENTATION=+